MMTAAEVFNQNDGGTTQSFYAELNRLGPLGEIAVALFRAQKRSSRAKEYRRGRFRRMAYDVKSWSLSELCRLLEKHGGFVWGWKQDQEVRFGEEASWVLYVDLPGFGQISFHSPTRGAGPEYPGDWDRQHASEERIIAFTDAVMAGVVAIAPAPTAEDTRSLAYSDEDHEQYLRNNPPHPLAKLRFGDPASIAMARRPARRSRA